MAGPTDMKSMNLEELTGFVTGMGERPFRARQLYEWLHKRQAVSFDEMTNLPKALRQRLSEVCAPMSLRLAERQLSKLDGTRKYLFMLEDGSVIESVLMRYRHGNSVCISSQAGCRMGCRFCASTLAGLARNLTPAEMLDQIYCIASDIGERISNVVVMGTGEPLDNYDNLLKFIELLTDENGLHISQRSLTVSTCGIVPRIYELAGENLQLTLALSLHAATQEKRRALMPVAEAYEIHEVIRACEDYFDRTGRRITYEYSLIEGVNDTAEDAGRLAELIGKRSCHVNLIPVNPVKEQGYRAPAERVAVRFREELARCHINATIRRELGRDIDGACGQLRYKYMKDR